MRTFLLVFTFLFGLSVKTAASNLENTSFSILSTEHGLSQKTALVIYQDRQGFMWVGTQEGLNRYDGKEIKIFRHLASNQQSISNDLIKDIQEDSLGRLWIATNNGLNLYNAASQSFKKITLKDEQGRNILRINALYAGSKGQIYVGTDGMGAGILEERDNAFYLKSITNTSHLVNANVKAFLKDSRSRLWIGTERQGLTLISGNQFLQFAANKSIKNSLSNNKIRDIVEDIDGNIWIATRGGGLNRFIELSQTFKTYLKQPESTDSLSHNRVYNIFQDSSRRLWIGTDGGVNLYQPANDNFIQIKNKSSQKAGLSHNRVFSIIEDTGGSIWFGTLSGVNIWNPHLAQFEHFRQIVEDPLTLSSNTISAFAERDDGTILVGTFGGGLNYLDLSKNTVAPLLSNGGKSVSQKRITSILVDSKKRIWTGSVTKGIDIFSENLEIIASLEKKSGSLNSLSANGVTDLIEDRNGNFWAATYGGGINKISNSLDKFQHIKTSSSIGKNIQSDRVHQLIEDDEGYVWAATDGGGISRIEPDTGLVNTLLSDPDNANGLSSNSAWSIFEDSKGRFWIGTQGNGLNRWEKKDRQALNENFKHYTLENSLPSNTINGVLEDYAGFIWISTNRGVSRLDPETDNIEHYNLSSELHFNEFNLGVMLRARSGRLFFGGLKGITTFKPENISKNTNRPRVVLTKVISQNKALFFEQPIETLEEITFKHDDYFVAFEFAALDFAQPNKNQYQYKLDGLDQDWIQLGNLNRATFTSLPSGNYQLKIKGSNNDGSWSDESVNLDIRVLPAPWFSWWAFSFYGFFICALILMLIRLQASRLANQELFKERVAEEVGKKTALYLSNNEFLRQQLEREKYHSFVDSESGLLNQRFIMAQIPPMVSLLNDYHDKDKHPKKLIMSLIGFQEDTLKRHRTSKAIELLNNLVEFKQADSTVASWGEDSMMVLSYAETPVQAKELVNAVLFGLSKEGFKLKIVSMIAPIRGVQTSIISGQDYLMLIEHLFTLVSKQVEIQTLFVSEALQDLSPTKIRQVLQSESFQQVAGLFDFDE